MWGIGYMVYVRVVCQAHVWYMCICVVLMIVIKSRLHDKLHRY